jgi:large subunit ribosomal protein L10
MSVVKNTLARRAANQTNREGLLEHLNGPSALVWVDGDPAQAAKALAGFAKEFSSAVTIKGGLLGNVPLSASDVTRLATLPSREQLLGQLAGTLQAPIGNLASGMSNMISGLARSLAALHTQRTAEQPQSA